LTGLCQHNTLTHMENTETLHTALLEVQKEIEKANEFGPHDLTDVRMVVIPILTANGVVCSQAMDNKTLVTRFIHVPTGATIVMDERPDTAAAAAEAIATVAGLTTRQGPRAFKNPTVAPEPPTAEAIDREGRLRSLILGRETLKGLGKLLTSESYDCDMRQMDPASRLRVRDVRDSHMSKLKALEE
jgi:hypothetical protein